MMRNTWVEVGLWHASHWHHQAVALRAMRFQDCAWRQAIASFGACTCMSLKQHVPSVEMPALVTATVPFSASCNVCARQDTFLGTCHRREHWLYGWSELQSCFQHAFGPTARYHQSHSTALHNGVVGVTT